MRQTIRNLMLAVPLAAVPAGGMALFAAPAFAYGPTACTPTVSVNPNPIVLGQPFTVSISGNCFSQSFTVQIHSTVVTLGTVTTNASGVGSGSFTAPTSLGSGAHTITVADGANGVATSVAVTAVGGVAAPAAGTPASASNGPLPFTGSNAAEASIIGAAAVAVGGALVLTSRRRKAAKFG